MYRSFKSGRFFFSKVVKGEERAEIESPDCDFMPHLEEFFGIPVPIDGETSFQDKTSHFHLVSRV